MACSATAVIKAVLLAKWRNGAEGFVEPKMYAAGDAATAAMNVVNNAGLVRLGVAADLLESLFRSRATGTPRIIEQLQQEGMG